MLHRLCYSNTDQVLWSIPFVSGLSLRAFKVLRFFLLSWTFLCIFCYIKPHMGQNFAYLSQKMSRVTSLDFSLKDHITLKWLWKICLLESIWKDTANAKSFSLHGIQTFQKRNTSLEGTSIHVSWVFHQCLL